MNQIKAWILLSSLLFLTACQMQSFIGTETLKQHNHPKIVHNFILKDIPERYHFQPIHGIDVQADPVLVINTENDAILYEKNIHESKAVASMSKMMTELLVLEAIDHQTIDWDTPVEISDYAYTISNRPGFASIELNKNQSFTVQDLFQGMALTSANGATIALAEKIAGSEKGFVALMNEKAKELNLTDSTFVNSTGLTNSDLSDNHPVGKLTDYNKMSAIDLAALAHYLIDHYPEFPSITSSLEREIKGESYDNSNWMLPGTEVDFLDIDVTFPGVDGLKTGFTNEAGYGFTGTVVIDGTRFISVVMGNKAIEERFIDTKELYQAIREQTLP